MQLLIKPCLTFLCLASGFQLLGAQEAATAGDAVNNIQLLAPTISIDNPLESTPELIELAWDSMEDVDGYYFELCLDNECTRVSYTSKTPETKVSLENLKVQSYYWRVHAIDAAGNIGLASSPQPLIINPSEIRKSEDASKPQAQPKSAETGALDSILALVKSLPWYVLLLIVAYAVYILRMLVWYLNK